jgi:CRP-like cAMP-binding protein
MIDDNLDLLEVVKELFAKTEFNFVVAKDGAEGLFKAKNQKFDVIICDFKMPKIDGEAFIMEFRTVAKMDVPIIIYSGHLDAIPPKLQLLKGIYKLAKPAQGYELIQRVRCLVSAPETETVRVLPIRYEAGSVLFQEADTTATCYWIKDGEVELYKEFSDGSQVVLATLSTGDFLGSYLPADERFRTFSARAKTSVQLKEITQSQIEKELEGKPEWFRALLLSSHAQLKSVHKTLKQKKAS